MQALLLAGQEHPSEEPTQRNICDAALSGTLPQTPHVISATALDTAAGWKWQPSASVGNATEKIVWYEKQWRQKAIGHLVLTMFTCVGQLPKVLPGSFLAS
jgi:hypothetical protein